MQTSLCLSIAKRGSCAYRPFRSNPGGCTEEKRDTRGEGSREEREGDRQRIRAAKTKDQLDAALTIIQTEGRGPDVYHISQVSQWGRKPGESKCFDTPD